MPAEVDHINGDGTDNKLVNLREVSRTMNNQNASRRVDNKSGVTGVSWFKPARKWQAYISVDCRRIYLGVFSDLDEAIAVRKAAELQHGFHENHGREKSFEI